MVAMKKVRKMGKMAMKKAVKASVKDSQSVAKPTGDAVPADTAVPSIKCAAAFSKWNPKPIAAKVTEFRNQAQHFKYTKDDVKRMLCTHFSQSERSQLYGKLDRETKKDPALKD